MDTWRGFNENMYDKSPVLSPQQRPINYYHSVPEVVVVLPKQMLSDSLLSPMWFCPLFAHITETDTHYQFNVCWTEGNSLG